MPMFSTKSSGPQVPPGFYCAQARGVTQVQKTTKKGEDCMVFVIPLYLPSGKRIVANVYLLEQTEFAVKGLCKSGNIAIPPIDGRAVISTDDLENRKFYIQVVHNELPDGRKVANVRFNSPSWIIQQVPELASVSFPNEAPPVTLRVIPDPEEPQDPSLKQPPGTQPPSASPSGQMSAPSVEEAISEEEMAEAIELARRLREKKHAA